MTPEALATFLNYGGMVAGLAITNWFLWQEIKYQRREKEQWADRYEKLVARLMVDPDIPPQKIETLLNGDPH